MTDLPTRLTAAPEGCEELDAEIVAHLNRAMVKHYPPTDDYGPRNRWQFWSLDGAHFLGNEAHPKFKVLPYTRSVDAASTLLPDPLAWSWKFIYEPEYTATGLRFCVELERVAPSSVASAATLPLAICAAALGVARDPAAARGDANDPNYASFCPGRL